MAEIKEVSSKYVILVTFEGKNRTVHDDVLYLGIFRVPIQFINTMYMLKLNVSPVLAKQVENDVSDNKYPKLKLQIYTVDPQGKQDDIANPLYERTLVIGRMTNESAGGMPEKGSVPIRMILIDPILYDMGKKLLFNGVKKGTALQILEEYEGFIKSKYGDHFEFKKKISDENKHIYEQILINPQKFKVGLPDGGELEYNLKSDMDVPLFLQSQYKTTNVFSFYFFDTFNLQVKKNICGTFVSLFDSKKLEVFDCSKQKDIPKLTHVVNTTPINDPSQTFNKENAVLNFRTSDMSYSTEKQINSKSPQQKNTNQTEYTLAGRQKKIYFAQSTNESKPAGQSSESLNIQSTDDSATAKTRFNNIKDTFNKKLDSIVEFETPQTTPDWLQFGTCYNLAENTPDEYIYTPVAICNIFMKLDTKGRIVEHNLKFMCVKFIKEK